MLTCRPALKAHSSVRASPQLALATKSAQYQHGPPSSRRLTESEEAEMALDPWESPTHGFILAHWNKYMTSIITIQVRRRSEQCSVASSPQYCAAQGNNSHLCHKGSSTCPCAHLSFPRSAHSGSGRSGASVRAGLQRTTPITGYTGLTSGAWYNAEQCTHSTHSLSHSCSQHAGLPAYLGSLLQASAQELIAAGPSLHAAPAPCQSTRHAYSHRPL